MALRVVRGTYRKAWSKLAKEPLGPKELQALGKLLVRVFAEEARKDFARRGWSLKAPGNTKVNDPEALQSAIHRGHEADEPAGGPPIDKSFAFRVVANQIEVMSTYYGLEDLLSKGIARHPLWWLTQEAAQRKEPSRTTPLVVPLRGRSGMVLFRVAPERIADAWVHPGVKRLTFGDRAVRRARLEGEDLLRAIVLERLAQGDPLR